MPKEEGERLPAEAWAVSVPVAPPESPGGDWRYLCYKRDIDGTGEKWTIPGGPPPSGTISETRWLVAEVLDQTGANIRIPVQIPDSYYYPNGDFPDHATHGYSAIVEGGDINVKSKFFTRAQIIEMGRDAFGWDHYKILLANMLLFFE